MLVCESLGCIDGNDNTEFPLIGSAPVSTKWKSHIIGRPQTTRRPQTTVVSNNSKPTCTRIDNNNVNTIETLRTNVLETPRTNEKIYLESDKLFSNKLKTRNQPNGIIKDVRGYVMINTLEDMISYHDDLIKSKCIMMYIPFEADFKPGTLHLPNRYGMNDHQTILVSMPPDYLFPFQLLIKDKENKWYKIANKTAEPYNSICKCITKEINHNLDTTQKEALKYYERLGNIGSNIIRWLSNREILETIDNYIWNILTVENHLKTNSIYPGSMMAVDQVENTVSPNMNTITKQHAYNSTTPSLHCQRKKMQRSQRKPSKFERKSPPSQRKCSTIILEVSQRNQNKNIHQIGNPHTNMCN